jgi:hypothetical protein
VFLKNWNFFAVFLKKHYANIVEEGKAKLDGVIGTGCKWESGLGGEEGSDGEG